MFFSWVYQLGVVQLNLEIGGVERDFSVSPLHATLILHFEGSAEVCVQDDNLMIWVLMVVLANTQGAEVAALL